MPCNYWYTALTVVAVMLMASEASAQRGRFGFFGSRGPEALVTLAANEAVQKDLGVAEVDARKLRELNDEYRRAIEEQMRGGRFDFEALRELNDEERRAALAEFGERRQEAAAKVNGEFEEKLAAIISPEEIGRLRQIRLQSEGAEALSNDDVAKQLALSGEQTSKLAEIRDQYTSRLSNFGRRSRDGGGQEGFERIRELTAERDAKLMEVLTAEQRQRFEALQGYPFDVSQIRSGFGRRGN